MACYSKCRILCTVWCSLEILLFGGIVYGWSSLVYILIDEGFYQELCEINSKTDIGNISGLSVKINNSLETFTDNSKSCADQESQLGLWFSVGVGCTWAGMAIIGPLSKAVGTRITRIIIFCVYEVGLFCLAFTNTETTWLLCPGLCCIGVSGLALLASNIQVSNLYKTYSSTVVALFCGLFDSSSVVFQLVKVAYGFGIGRRESFLFLACVHLVMIGTSTFCILPKRYITGAKKEQQEVEIYVNDEQYREVKQISTDTSVQRTVKARSLLSYVKSLTYISHVSWMTINCLLFATFLNLLFIRIDYLADGEEHIAGYYIGVFAYTTLGSLIGTVIAGLIYDYQRKQFCGRPFPENKWKPVAVPMIACGVLITTVFSFMLIENISFLFPSFILFTLFRNFLFSIGIAFINEAFPPEYFGSLYGFMTLINGVFSLSQYCFVKWTVSSPNGYYEVHIVLLVLAVLTFLHPLQLWIRANKINRKTATLKSEELSPLHITTKTSENE